MQEYREYWDTICGTRLFNGFADGEIEQALGCLSGVVGTYERKQTIFRTDDVLDAAGIILSGQVLLCKDNMAGTRIIFSELECGDIVGETALRQSREESGYEAVAGAECKILFVQIGKIVSPGRETCHLRARIIENMMALLLENNRAVYRKLDLVSHKSLRDRIMHYLTLQAQKNNGTSFEIPFSRSELADYLTADRSALSRELQRMAQDGLIAFSGNRFELLDETVPTEPAAPRRSPSRVKRTL